MRGKYTTGQIGSFVMLSIGIFFLINAMKLNIGSLSNPGAGLWPLCLSVVIIIASIVSLFPSAQSQEEEAGENTGFSKTAWFVILGAASIVLFIVLFERWGMTLSSFLLLFFWIRVLGKEKWRSSVFAAFGFTVFSIVVFVWGIQAPFPNDLLLSFVRGG